MQICFGGLKNWICIFVSFCLKRKEKDFFLTLNKSFQKKKSFISSESLRIQILKPCDRDKSSIKIGPTFMTNLWLFCFSLVCLQLFLQTAEVLSLISVFSSELATLWSFFFNFFCYFFLKIPNNFFLFERWNILSNSPFRLCHEIMDPYLKSLASSPEQRLWQNYKEDWQISTYQIYYWHWPNNNSVFLFERWSYVNILSSILYTLTLLDA